MVVIDKYELIYCIGIDDEFRQRIKISKGEDLCGVGVVLQLRSTDGDNDGDNDIL
jgi:hypothetical protein